MVDVEWPSSSEKDECFLCTFTGVVSVRCPGGVELVHEAKARGHTVPALELYGKRVDREGVGDVVVSAVLLFDLLFGAEDIYKPPLRDDMLHDRTARERRDEGVLDALPRERLDLVATQEPEAHR
jgi:hypothetical protein